jgi:hypothetical protein
MYHQTEKEMVQMDLRDEILRDAVEGTKCVPEWVAYQTVRLYREQVAAGLSHDAAVDAAQREMVAIMNDALRIRREQKWDALWRDHIAPWCVVILGALACIGWWLLWG